MSIISSLVIVLLFLSFQYACNARSFGVVHKETAKKLQPSISKKNEKLNPARVSIQPDRKSSIPNATKDAKEESRFEKEKVNNESDEPGKHIQPKGNPVNISGTTQTGSESLASVSWKVPHKKRGEQEPGFNLDYLPPKTHPPVHN
ncbi:hypothetical protein Pfo_001387 [Paulownia fortunei]|nr:hypothetical protein Pfo_001387 [Paulownia fortunei]